MSDMREQDQMNFKYPVPLKINHLVMTEQITALAQLHCSMLIASYKGQYEDLVAAIIKADKATEVLLRIIERDSGPGYLFDCVQKEIKAG
jgi:hypothetical protein